MADNNRGLTAPVAAGSAPGKIGPADVVISIGAAGMTYCVTHGMTPIIPALLSPASGARARAVVVAKDDETW